MNSKFHQNGFEKSKLCNVKQCVRTQKTMGIVFNGSVKSNVCSDCWWLRDSENHYYYCLGRLYSLSLFISNKWNENFNGHVAVCGSVS